jgi:hypothetical protein
LKSGNLPISNCQVQVTHAPDVEVVMNNQIAQEAAAD